MKKVVLAILLAVAILLPVPGGPRANSFPNQDKHHAMLRLEDVSSGAYATLDDLGKLRAVFEYLQDQKVPFQVATIPRSKLWQADGTWYEKGIDDPNPDEQLQKFIKLLKSAQDHGAVLGMHGYTHQYGDTKRSDNNQDTGTGFEFNVKGAPETATVDYAAGKISQSLVAFEKNGLVPGFWESPHYQDTRQQEEVFRSFAGILYQPDFRSLRSLKDLNVYETENQYGRTTLGSVYVPAPLKYIYDGNTANDVLKKLDTYRGLGSMFYHPFLEFPSLEPVKDANGKPQQRDGLPVYRYKAGTTSDLHRLVEGFRSKGYNWVSLYDVVPFSPAHRIDLPLGTKAGDFLLGDVSDAGHADVVVRENDRIEVFTGIYKWPRNRSQRPAQVWLKHSFAADERLTLGDVNGDGMQDLISYQTSTGKVEAFLSNGSRFDEAQPLMDTVSGASEMLTADVDANGYPDLILRKADGVYVSYLKNGQWQPAQQVLSLPADATLRTGDFDGDKRTELACYLPEDHSLHIYRQADGRWTQVKSLPIDNPKQDLQLLVSDTNGDGRADVVVYDAANGIWQVFQAGNDFDLKPLDNLFGPWARGNRIAYTADFDGNGKADIAAYDENEHVLDLGLSFR